MSHTLLRALIREAIRSTRRSGPVTHFDMRQFRSLEEPGEMRVYATSFLEPLGQEGSSRRVFLLSSGKVLKIALNAKGIAQNGHEVVVSETTDIGDLLARVLDHHPKNMWVVSELVRPVHGASEFEQRTGIQWKDFEAGVLAAGKGRKPATTEGFLSLALELIRKEDLHYGDLAVLDHWGVTPDGRVVLLDYGASRGIWTDLYGKESNSDLDTTVPVNKP